MFDVTTSSPARVLEMHGLRETLRSLPDYHEKELALLRAEVGDVANREALARRIADQLLAQHPDASAPKNELVESVLAKLDDLQHDLEMEQDELLRKAEVFNRIEKDPVKKGLLEKAMDTVKSGWSFSWKHKWKILAVIAVIATGVAGWYYWGQLGGLLGLGGGAAEGAGSEAAAGGIAQGMEQTATGAAGKLGAAQVAGESVASSQSAADILAGFGLSENASYVMQGAQITGEGIIYQGQTYTPEAFANLATCMAEESGSTFVTGYWDKFLSVGDMKDLEVLFQQNNISYRFDPPFENGGTIFNYDSLRVK